jgi:hypothetical protein
MATPGMSVETDVNLNARPAQLGTGGVIPVPSTTTFTNRPGRVEELVSGAPRFISERSGLRLLQPARARGFLPESNAS